MNFEGNLLSDIPISWRGKLQIQIQKYMIIPTEKTYIILIWESVQIIFLRCKCVHQLFISIDFIPAWQYNIILYMLLPIVHMHLGRLRSFWADFGHVQLAQELSFLWKCGKVTSNKCVIKASLGSHSYPDRPAQLPQIPKVSPRFGSHHKRGTTWMVISPNHLSLSSEEDRPKLILYLDRPYLGLLSRGWHYSISTVEFGNIQRQRIIWQLALSKRISNSRNFSIISQSDLFGLYTRCIKVFFDMSIFGFHLEFGRGVLILYKSTSGLKIGNWGRAQMFWCCGSRHVGNSIWGVVESLGKLAAYADGIFEGKPLRNWEIPSGWVV